MLNSGKKILSNSCVVEIFFLNETKNHTPPPPFFKLNVRFVSSNMIKHSQTVSLKSLQKKKIISASHQECIQILRQMNT